MEIPTSAQLSHSTSPTQDMSSPLGSMDPTSEPSTSNDTTSAGEAEAVVDPIAQEVDTSMSNEDTSEAQMESQNETDHEDDDMYVSDDGNNPNGFYYISDAASDNAQEEEENNNRTNSEMSSTKTQPPNPEACLEGLPGEIQDMILEYLLINSDLGRSISVSEDTGYGKNAAYELHPAIMQVCRRLYERGSGVLYGRNIFYVACLPDNWARNEGVQSISSPITRFVRGYFF